MNTAILPIYNAEGKETDKINLAASVFDGKVNQGALHQAIVNFLANQRRGLASTKTRGEVSGGGRKPWRQKGTGRARVGSIRSPLWKGGGVVFGPHPRDFSYDLPRKIKLLALKSSLNAKLNEGNILIIDELKTEKPKTKEMVKLLANLKINVDEPKQRSLLLADKIDRKVRLSSNNLPGVEVALSNETHAYQVLKARKVIITVGGLKQLTDRLKRISAGENTR